MLLPKYLYLIEQPCEVLKVAKILKGERDVFYKISFIYKLLAQASFRVWGFRFYFKKVCHYFKQEFYVD